MEDRAISEQWAEEIRKAHNSNLALSSLLGEVISQYDSWPWWKRWFYRLSWKKDPSKRIKQKGSWPEELGKEISIPHFDMNLNVRDLKDHR